MKCTCPTQRPNARDPTPGTQRNLYSTGLRLGFASGKMQLLGFASGEKCASPNAKYTNMLVYFALGNAKFWRRVHCPMPTPDARYFASQWNIGLRDTVYMSKLSSSLPPCSHHFSFVHLCVLHYHHILPTPSHIPKSNWKNIIHLYVKLW